MLIDRWLLHSFRPFVNTKCGGLSQFSIKDSERKCSTKLGLTTYVVKEIKCKPECEPMCINSKYTTKL